MKKSCPSVAFDNSSASMVKEPNRYNSVPTIDIMESEGRMNSVESNKYMDERNASISSWRQSKLTLF